MKTYTAEELKDILAKHQAWLVGEPGGERADLSYANLSYANLRNADLHGANLRNADLSYANLRHADLSYTDLSCADLRNADLSGADFRHADLSGADLHGADLSAFQIVPQEGSFFAYKKVCTTHGPAIAKLKISKCGLRTSSLMGRKCRTSRALVVSITLIKSGASLTEAHSIHDPSFKYVAGQVVEAPDYDGDIRVECTRGIHFFITEQEARDY